MNSKEGSVGSGSDLDGVDDAIEEVNSFLIMI